MDHPALQEWLRRFAEARDWQSRHTPKNLAMALTVETAGLLELFQWATLSESRGVAQDPASTERLAAGIASVQLCLLQLADHTGVDVARAVVHQMRRDVQKHPPKRPDLEPPLPELTELHGAGDGEKPIGCRVHLLVDWENVQPKGSELKALEPEGTDVWLFHGPHQKVDTSGHASVYGDQQVTLIPRTGAGRNALDFQLAYYVGYISARQPEGTFVIVSNDQGYESMLAHARELGFDARRCEFRRVSAAAAPVTFAPAAAPPDPAKVTRPPPPSAVAQKVTPAPPKSASSAKTTLSQATRADIRQLLAQLEGLAASQRPAHKDALQVLLQNWLGESSPHSLRTLHALSQLQARRCVAIKGATVTYPVPDAVKPVSKKASPQPSAAVQKLQKESGKATKAKHVALSPTVGTGAGISGAVPPSPAPTAAQVARAVLASFRKMTLNKPRKRSGLVKHIQTHAARAEDPAAMAQRVLSLLLVRKNVRIAPDGESVIYFV
jgi:NTP pyrophosphatase (non-canonical NTP hydrolase)